MAVTITNKGALSPFMGRLSAVQQSVVTGALAPTVPVVVFSDSKAGALPIRDPFMGIHKASNSWAGRIIAALKQYAGDGGTMNPCEHDEERYHGAAVTKHATTNAGIVYRRSGEFWGAVAPTLGGQRAVTGAIRQDVDGIKKAPYGLCATNVCPSTVPAWIDEYPHPFRFLDIIHPTLVANTKEPPTIGTDCTAALTVTVDALTPTSVTILGDADTYNNVTTIDAGAYGIHRIKMVSVSGFSTVEGLCTRTGYPGVIDWNASVSGERLTYLEDYSTAALKRDYLGLNALVSMGHTTGLVIAEIGFNDASADDYGATSLAYTKAALVDWFDAVPAGWPILWVLHPQVASEDDTRAYWAEIVAYVLANVANASRICVADCFQPNASWSGTGGWPTGGTSPRGNAYTAGYLHGIDLLQTWQRNRYYRLGEVLRQSVSPRRQFECTTAGASGNAEPTWATDDSAADMAIGGLKTDGGAVWTCLAVASTDETFIQDITHPSLKGHLAWAQSLLDGLGWSYMDLRRIRGRRLFAG